MGRLSQLIKLFSVNLSSCGFIASKAVTDIAQGSSVKVSAC